MSWILPTGFNDPNTKWTDETHAYDGSLAETAFYTGNLAASSWSSFLELTHSAMGCDKVKFYAPMNAGWITQIDIDAYYSGTWHNVYQGVYSNNTWTEKTFSIQLVTKFRFRFYNSNASYPATPILTEVEFNHVPPVVTTQALTIIKTISATGNGNITDVSGENCTKRGMCWNTTGSPTVVDDKEEETGDFGTGAFTRSLTGLTQGQKYYVKAYAYNSAGYVYGDEVEFTTLNITTQTPTIILPTTATANGNIIAIGGENATVRGFKYGLTKTDTWDAHDDGDFGTGTYTKSLTSLVANTFYWIQAYFTNPNETVYGEWVQFQTAASGVIPTGTQLFICSDYSGYTYQLMRAETDDGETYTAYFVISTDLTEKQGLAFYKRILDLHLYFMSESSGTATIEVKRDNEASWQSVGEVSLVETEDIIVKHLAPDIRAKVFLFKISATNMFRFLGVLFEYLPESLR